MYLIYLLYILIQNFITLLVFFLYFFINACCTYPRLEIYFSIFCLDIVNLNLIILNVYASQYRNILIEFLPRDTNFTLIHPPTASFATIPANTTSAPNVPDMSHNWQLIFTPISKYTKYTSVTGSTISKYPKFTSVTTSVILT